MSHRSRRFSVLAAVVFFVLAAGCKSKPPDPYESRFKFMPPSQVATLRFDKVSDNTPPAATATASIAGVRKDDADSGADSGIPSSIEVRIRIDNRGPATASLDPGSLELLTGGSEPFPPPQTEPSSTMVVQPTESRQLVAYFVFPTGKKYDDMKLKDVRVNYVVKLDDKAFPQVAVFNYLP